MSDEDADPAEVESTAKSRAAGLLISAVHRLDDVAVTGGGRTQLACLAAVDALDVIASVPTTDEGATPETLIRDALLILGSLLSVTIADPRIVEASRCARLAFRHVT